VHDAGGAGRDGQGSDVAQGSGGADAGDAGDAVSLTADAVVDADDASVGETAAPDTSIDSTDAPDAPEAGNADVRDARPDGPCSAAECFPPPAGPGTFCLDGTFVPEACLRSAAGACKWMFQACPPVVCPDPLPCTNTCPLGRHIDSKGCATCECVLAGDCAALSTAAACNAVGRCRWVEPGCAGSPLLAKSGCFERTDLDCLFNTPCPGGRTCAQRVVNMCVAADGGAAACAENCSGPRNICF
jgi:hypothetical protein